MSVTPAAVTLRPFHGLLHPADGEAVDVTAVLSHLRAKQVLASVQSTAPTPDEACDLVLLLDDVDRVQVLRDGRVSPGAPVTSFGPALARAMGLEVEIAGEFYDDAASAEAPTEHPDVLVSRVVDSALPFLAHDLGSLVAGHVDGWTVARFDHAHIALDEHGWLPGDLPAVLLTRTGQTRTVQVITRWTDPFGHVLDRTPELTATFSAAEITEAAVEALTQTHLAPDSEVSDLLVSECFPAADAAAVSRALQSQMDDRWTSRVLAALGLPTLAADVHEGRADVPLSSRVRATSTLRSLVATVQRYYDAPPQEVARRTPYGKFYDRVQRHPAAAGVVIGVEVVGGAWMLRRATRPSSAGGARTALVAGAVLALTDAGLGAALAVRRFRHV